MLRSAIAAFLAFSGFVLVHFLHFHYFIPADKVQSVIRVALLGAVSFFILLRLLPSEEKMISFFGVRRWMRFLPAAIGLALYASLFLGYLEFYFTADRSITFRMLRIIGDTSGGVSEDEMLKAYDTNAIILRRFEDLVYGGYLKKEDGKYLLTGKGDRTLLVYRFTIDYLNLGKF